MHGGVGSRGKPFDVVSAIRGLSAAAICLQEAWLPDPSLAPADTAGSVADGQGDLIAEAAGQLDATLLRVAQREVPDLTSCGIPANSGPGQLCIAILTTLPVMSAETISLGRVPGDVPRLAQVVTLALPNGSAMRLINTHLTHRLASPIQLVRLWRILRASRVPTIIAGDLNMPRFFARLAPGYSPTVIGRTWPAELPVVQLDHLLAGSGIDVVESAVLPSVGSDHLPIWARLDLQT